jgi:excisionase family DNA binding protein
MSNSGNIPRLLSLREVADTLGVSTRTVHRFIKAGDLVAHRIGGQLRIALTDLDTFLKIRRQR